MSSSNPTSGDPPDGVVKFSLVDEYVWVSWPDQIPKVRLGPCENITAGMRDFLAQCELGRRLAKDDKDRE